MTEQGREISVVEIIDLPTNAILVITVAPDTTDKALAQVRKEMRAVFDQLGWGDRPIGILRAGDMKFTVIVPEEKPEGISHAN